MRLSDLRDKRIRTLDGEKLGRVHEVHCDNRRIVALDCGPGSLLERLTARRHGRRIPWEWVRRVTDREVVIAPGKAPGKSSKEATGSRTRQRTPRPSARR